MTASHALSQLSYGPRISSADLAAVSACNDRREKGLTQRERGITNHYPLPSPCHVVNPRQIVQVRPQLRPVSLRVFLQAVAAHEPIDLRSAIKHRLYVARCGFMTVEMIMEGLCLFVEVLDKGIDVIFPPRAVKAALVQRAIQTLAKPV